jgi:hypothetical protein
MMSIPIYRCDLEAVLHSLRWTLHLGLEQCFLLVLLLLGVDLSNKISVMPHIDSKPS